MESSIVEYKGFDLNIYDYSIIVSHNGITVGEFETESEAKSYIDFLIGQTDEIPNDSEYNIPGYTAFTKFTGIEMNPYDSSTYIEIGGMNYKEIQDKINKFNRETGSFVLCYYDYNKDAVFIKL